tara:strand:- start:440 stop:661 length:222 start_codon:yes stop_codon:yes gene_type:complete
MITKKDILRPILGLFAIQPIVIIYLIITNQFNTKDYLYTGWGLQIAITFYLIFFYAWYERSKWFDFENQTKNE